MMRRIRALSVAPVTVLATALLAGGCTSAHHEGHKPSSSPVTTTKRTFKLAASGSVSVDVPSQPIATAPTTTAGIQVELYAVRRSSHVADVVLALHDMGQQKVPTWKVLQGLDEYDHGENSDKSASAVALIDPEGLKEYQTFFVNPNDPDSGCVCSPTQDGSQVPEEVFTPGERRYYVSEVAAPPASVSKVTVYTGVASFPNVTITG